jgi:hypothetical protein
VRNIFLLRHNLTPEHKCLLFPSNEFLFVARKGLQREGNIEHCALWRRAWPDAALKLNDVLPLVLISQYLLSITNMAKPCKWHGFWTFSVGRLGIGGVRGDGKAVQILLPWRPGLANLKLMIDFSLAAGTVQASKPIYSAKSIIATPAERAEWRSLWSALRSALRYTTGQAGGPPYSRPVPYIYLFTVCIYLAKLSQKTWRKETAWATCVCMGG